MASTDLVWRTDGGRRAAGETLPQLARLPWKTVERRIPQRGEFDGNCANCAGRGCAGRERIFALGGDGTVQALLNAVAGNSKGFHWLLPAGGGNDLAAALGCRWIPCDAAEIF